MRRATACAIGAALLLIGCGAGASRVPAGDAPTAMGRTATTGGTEPRGGTSPTPSATGDTGAGPGTGASASTTPGAAATTIDLTRLPIGDSKVSTVPAVGSVFACQRSFGGGGAFRDGPWIRSDGTFDYTAKLAVAGARRLGGEFNAMLSGGTRLLTGNGLPAHALGQFPVAASDPAYQYDRNPNTIRAMSLRYAVPAEPQAAASPSCLPMGAVGVMTTGVVFFNALDALGRDAVAHEILDACGGHPERTGQYHYHDQAPCIEDAGSGHSALIGYAFDGFGIFGRRGEGGQLLTNRDLDACHGHTHAIPWDHRSVVMYHYHATYEYPYTLGCYRGTPMPAGR
jgi:hypothetical protein